TYCAFVPAILDNLIAAKKIPQLVALMIGSGPQGRVAELECSPAFTDFLASELIPWARRRYHGSNGLQTIAAGSSVGGLEALFAGFRHPEAIGKVLSQSGSFWWKPERDAEPEWLARQLAAAPKLPLKILLQVGSMEVPDQLGSNRHMRDVLTAKGYAVFYSE